MKNFLESNVTGLFQILFHYAPYAKRKLKLIIILEFYVCIIDVRSDENFLGQFFKHKAHVRSIDPKLPLSSTANKIMVISKYMCTEEQTLYNYS